MAEPSVPDWISAIAQVVSTIVAIVVARIAYMEYLRPPVQDSAPDAANAEVVESISQEAVVFQTSKQKTTLRVSPIGLECHLDDKRSGRGGHQWTISRREAGRILTARDYSVNPTYRSSSGLFSIGRRQNWLYSKKLFPEPEYLHGTLGDLLRQAADGATEQD